MDDTDLKLKYRKCKFIIKQWEKTFKKNYGRVPSKLDIHDASIDIKNSYKLYYKLKTSFLESTLNDILLDDDEYGFDPPYENTQQIHHQDSDNILDNLLTPPMIQLESDQDDNNKCNNSNENLSEMLPTSSDAPSSNDGNGINRFMDINKNVNNTKITTFDADAVSEINLNAWGKHLNRAKPILDGKKQNNQELSLSQRSNKKLTDKLFKNASFSIPRNPRKSLTKLINNSTNIDSTTIKGTVVYGNTQTTNSTLPDLETILMEKSLKCDKESNSSGNSKQQSGSSKILTTVNNKWLNRCSSTTTGSGTFNSNPDSNGQSRSEIIQSQLENQEEEEEEDQPNQSTKYGLSNCNIKNNYMENTLTVENKYDDNNEFDDEEDVIANSEDETQENSIKHIYKKRKLSDIIKESLSMKQTTATTPPETKSKILDDRAKLNGNETIQTTKVVEEYQQDVDQQLTIKSKKSSDKKPTKKYTIRKSKQSINYGINDNHSDDSEIDPFANDSESDPDFKCDEKELMLLPPKKTKTIKKSPIPQPKEKSIKKKIKKQSTRSSSRASTAAAAASASRTKNKQRKSKASVEDDSKNEPEQYKPYAMEYGDTILQINPCMAIKELHKTSKIFNDFISNQNPTKTTNNKIDSNEIQLAIEHDDDDDDDVATARRKKKNNNPNDENYVRINLKKKIFVRGKKHFNFSKYKKSMWKKSKTSALSGPDTDMRGCDGGALICFQCGKPGHFAERCPIKGDQLLPITVDNDESPHLTLEEVERLANTNAKLAHCNKPENQPVTDNHTWKDDELLMESSQQQQQTVKENNTKEYIGHIIPEEFLKKSGILENSMVDNCEKIEPIYKLNADNNSINETPSEVMEALKRFGHDCFRPGQEQAIMRILSGLSTLVTLSTGSGKSLCYQLPAYLYRKHYNCIVLVISPLVSLMEDQVHGVPHFINAQCLHTNQNKTKYEQTIEQIKSGKVDCLLISPEAIVASEKSTGFRSLFQILPPIAFACIDEAHCVSQWSHNFRPSYLMVCRVLRERLKVKTILGLTATATIQTKESIVNYLSIPDGIKSVISDVPIPDNLMLTTSKDEHRDEALLRLLRSKQFYDYQSIIIYCTRRDECERIARILRTCFQPMENNVRKSIAPTNGKRKRITIDNIVEAYHAGLSSGRRCKIQNDFMSGKIKIVVATIAFGMGINKSDIRAVIHYNMPMNFECYVQEVGRAGRDGKPAHCHVFLDSKNTDKYELRRHIFGNSIDRYAIRKLLEKVFVPCACIQNDDKKILQNKNHNNNGDGNLENTAKTKRICPGHEVGFSIDSVVQTLDIPEENIETLLCYLELHENRYIQVLSKAYITCKIISYSGPSAIKQAAQKCPPLAMAIALDLKKGISHTNSTVIEFSVISIAATIGWNSGIVKYQLKNLEWMVLPNGQSKRSTISVEFHDLGFRVRAVGDLSDIELDSTLELLHSRVVQQESAQLLQLKTVSQVMSESGAKTVSLCLSDIDLVNDITKKLKLNIRNYFQNDKPNDFNEINTQELLDNDEQQTDDSEIISNIRSMIVQYPDNNFTGRALARIFQGIQSPAYTAIIWSRCKYWRAHLNVDFNRMVKLANVEIVKMRT